MKEKTEAFAFVFSFIALIPFENTAVDRFFNVRHTRYKQPCLTTAHQHCHSPSTHDASLLVPQFIGLLQVSPHKAKPSSVSHCEQSSPL